MGEEVSWDDIPEPRAAELGDYFKPVRLSPRAIDQASRIVPPEHWIGQGLHTWLSMRANHVFKSLPSDRTEAQFGKLKYIFEFDAQGPVLKTVGLA